MSSESEEFIKQQAAINTMNSRRVRKRRQSVLEKLYRMKEDSNKRLCTENSKKEGECKVLSQETVESETVSIWKQAQYEAIRRYSGRIFSMAEQVNKQHSFENSDQLYDKLRKNALEILESITCLAPNVISASPLSPQNIQPDSPSQSSKDSHSVKLEPKLSLPSQSVAGKSYNVVIHSISKLQEA